MNAEQRKWHEIYASLPDAPGWPKLAEDVYSGSISVDPSDLHEAIDAAFNAVKEMLLDYMPDGYKPPMDDRAEALIAAITSYAFGRSE